MKLDPLACLARIFAELRRKEGTAEDDSVELQCRHPLSQARRIDKGRTDKVEGPCRSPSLRDVRGLEYTGPDIVYRAVDRGYVRRRIDPQKVGVIGKKPSVPSGAGYNIQPAVYAVFPVYELRKLADGQSVARRYRKFPDARKIFFLKQSALDPDAPDGVYTVENDHLPARPGAKPHEVGKAVDIGIEPCPDILNVVDKDINVFKRRLEVFALPVADGDKPCARLGILRVVAPASVLKIRPNPVFGGKKHRKVIFIRDKVNCRHGIPVYSRSVREKPNPLPAEKGRGCVKPVNAVEDLLPALNLHCSGTFQPYRRLSAPSLRYRADGCLS